MSAPFVYDPLARDFGARIREIYRTLRDEHPVYYDAERDLYALSRFEDVWNAAGDWKTFSSVGAGFSKGLLPMMLNMNPPRHEKLRNLVSRAFTPRRVQEMEPRVRAIARELLDRFAGEGRGDLRQRFAAQLPSLVIGEMIGVPPERRESFLHWTEMMIETDPDATVQQQNEKPAASIYREFASLLEERRRERREDLMSALVDAEVDGERLSQEELLGFCFLLIVGGNDTTANLIANGALLLAQHPEQRAVLAASPAAIPAAIEEMLRFDAPSQALPRVASYDVSLHGTTIPAGANVQLVWGAANHDEREFEDPDRFDVTREIKRHLAFGHGVHFCLGVKLARLEARIAFEELLARIPAYELDGEPRWVRSHWARALGGLPIRFDTH